MSPNGFAASSTDLFCSQKGLSKSVSVGTRKMVKLCLNRAKPAETLEARSDSDVQIDRRIWV